uniref:O-methyltransferase-2 n=1 Tax=Vanilla planifolia TaxID=51239 RepID=Q27I63_VANPL|nr:O-methyltransferase-2 [Vanilla planifolia]
MGSIPKNQEEVDVCNYAQKLVSCVVLPMTLNAAIQLGLFEEIVAAGPGARLSAEELASRIGSTNPLAPALLHRILRLLASYSIVTSSEAADNDGRGTTIRYGAAPVCKYLTRNEDGVSLASISQLTNHKIAMESWYHVKDAVLHGGVPFNMAHGGLNEFEYHATDPSFSKVFNEAMRGHSVFIMRNILKVYRGFDEAKVMVDVCGGTGGTLGMITAKHPHIKGINFDLPHVIAQAPPLPGVEHVGGDVFASVPSGDTVLLKWVLHDWNDEDCVRILKNCKKAIPETGKVVVVESVVPESLESSDLAHFILHSDLVMLLESPCGKERTKKDFRSLAQQSGFSGFAVLCSFSSSWVMEFTN